MRSDVALTALRDIAYHIDLAVRFAAGLDYEKFCDDLRTVLRRYALFRDHLRGFAPASRRAQGAIPTIAWREMAGASNVYRHDYEDVALSYVWTTLRNHLPPLRAVIQHELAVVDQPPEGRQ
jgi:uncharacterized protein with HEPN domain